MPFKIGVEVPKMLVTSARVHNRLIRASLSSAMFAHATKREPVHFTRPARAKYAYKPRSTNYAIAKQRKYKTGGLDLVKTGALRRKALAEYKLTVSGSAVDKTGADTAKGVSGTIRFPFPESIKHRNVKNPRAVTLKDMKRELEALTPDELLDISRDMELAYGVLVETSTIARQRIDITKK